MNWKILAAAMLAVFITAGCGVGKTDVTLQNALGEWKITSLTLTGPGTEETTLDAMAPNGKAELQLARGSYTLNATDEEGNSYRLGFTVEADPVTVRIGFENSTGFANTVEVTEGVYWTGSGDALVTIINDTGGWSIWYVYCDLSTDPWGEDRMGAHILYDGEELNILVPAGTYDIQCEDEDYDTYTRWSVDVAAGSPYIWNVTLDDLDYGWDDYDDYDYDYDDYEVEEGSAPVTIQNDLGMWDIWYVYCDPSTDPWGSDRLGANILYAGEEFTFLVNPGVYDLRVEDEDGDTYTKWGVTIPEGGYTWAVTLGDMD